MLQNLSDNYKVGFLSIKHTYWVIPVETNDPDGLINHLRSNDFDATQKASSLVMIKNPDLIFDQDELMLDHLVYLPVYPAMSKKDRNKLNQLLIGFLH